MAPILTTGAGTFPAIGGGGGGGLTGSESDGTNVIPSGGNGFTAGWSQLATAATTAAATAPDGTTTAEFLKEDSATGRHIQYRSDIPLSASTTYTYSVYAKINGRRYLQIYADPGGGAKAYAYFDLSGGVVGDVNKTAGAEITGTPTSAIAVGANGFYKCSVTFTNTSLVSFATITTNLSDVGTYGAPLSSDAPSYTGDNASGIYLWRPKVAI